MREILRYIQKGWWFRKNEAYSFDMVTNKGTSVRTQTCVLPEKDKQKADALKKRINEILSGDTNVDVCTLLAILNKKLNKWHRYMDKKTLEFVTYCIGKLSAQLQLPQKEIYKRLKTSGILYDYIVPSYDVLHTFSSRYLMEDLTEYMREKGVLSAWDFTIHQT